jgi:hypothetical protein
MKKPRGKRTVDRGNNILNKFMITEEWTGYFKYHISYRNTYTKPICGKEITTMQTAIPMDAWGHRSEHIRETYCPVCKEMYDEMSKM